MNKKSKKSLTKPRRQNATTAAVPKVQKILVTTDFSHESRSGVRYAVALANQLRATVALLHVIEPPPRLSVVESVVLVREESEVIKLAREELATLAKHASQGSVAITYSVRTGNPSTKSRPQPIRMQLT